MPSDTAEYLAAYSRYDRRDYDDEHDVGIWGLFDIGFSFAMDGEPLGFVGVAQGANGIGGYVHDHLPVIFDSVARREEKNRLDKLVRAPSPMKCLGWKKIELLMRGESLVMKFDSPQLLAAFRVYLNRYNRYAQRFYSTKRTPESNLTVTVTRRA